MNLINIITPCSRVYNLEKLSKSINIPSDEYRWITIIEGWGIPEQGIPKNCEFYTMGEKTSDYGNGQRNYALNLIERGHICFLDDDTIMHPELWENIKDLEEDFISYNQEYKDGTPRLIWNPQTPRWVDSGNFIVSYKCMGDIRWQLNIYAADGIFAEECYKRAKSKIYIPKTLSTYNALRD